MGQFPPSVHDGDAPAWRKRFRRLAVALPGASEQDHWGRPSFRVGKRIFATLWPDEGKAMIKLTPDQQDEHVEEQPQTFVPVPRGWGLQGATFVMLRGKGAAGQVLLEKMLLIAWRNAAPKTLVKSLAQPTKPNRPKKSVRKG